MTLGEKIKEARKQNGLTQEQLAEKMNVSRSAVAKWESDIEYSLVLQLLWVFDKVEPCIAIFALEDGFHTRQIRKKHLAEVRDFHNLIVDGSIVYVLGIEPLN